MATLTIAALTLAVLVMAALTMATLPMATPTPNVPWQDLVGQWEVEQLSEITGDSSTSGTIQCRLSIVTCKAAFMDSQSGELVGAGQGNTLSESGLLDFTEFQELPLTEP